MPHTLHLPPLQALPSLSEALDAIDRAESSAARVRVAADQLHAFGLDRVVITLRDASLNATVSVTLGEIDADRPSSYALQPLPGAVWRRRLTQLDRFKCGDLYVLDGTDPWVAREFFGTEESPRAFPEQWVETDLVLGLMRGAEQELLGIVKLAAPRSRTRPNESLLRDLGVIIRHLSARVAHDSLRVLAQQRAERLQRLQEAGAALARSLDEHEIMRELARQAQRVTRADGVTIAFPDLDQDILTTALRQVRGVDRPRGPVRLGDGIIGEVARTGRPVRVGDRDADRARERAGLVPPLSMYDVVGDASPASSVLAVPLLAGIHLLAVLVVFAASREVFDAEDEEVLATMASQAATAIANARRYAESERERRQTEALAEVAKAVSESLRLGEVLRLILRHSVALLGVEGACIALRQDDYLHIVAAVGAADVLAGVHLPVANSLLGHAMSTNELVVSNDFRHNPNASKAVLHLATIHRTVIAPLVTGRGTIGAIAVINRDEPFRDEDARVLQRLADHVAVAIVNARLFEEVERATREWKLAFDSIASGMVVLDEAQKVQRCNARAAELCGGTIASLLDVRFPRALLGDAESRESLALVALIQRSIEAEEPMRELVRDEMNARLFEVLVSPHPDGGCVLTFSDVTSAHRLAERHRRVLETVSDSIVITGLDGRIAFANAAAHDLFEYEQLIGQHVSSLAASESLAEVVERERSARDGVQQRYECVVVRADGERRVVAVSSAPLVELGQVTGTVASLRDITGQRAEAIALARSEDRYERLVESATDAIFTVDAAGCFTSVNQSLLFETGRTREELIGASCKTLIDPADVPAVERLIAHIFAGGKERLELRFRAPNGVMRVGMVTTAPIVEAGVVVGALGVMRDITEDEIRRESSAQQERLAAVGQLLSGVANELNNPLASLLAVAELEARTMSPDAVHRQVIAQICDEAQRASRIVAQLLDTTGERPTERSAVDVNRIVRGTLELHAYHFRLQRINIESVLWPTQLLVHADGAQLQQLLMNLLVNAEEALRDWAGTRLLRVATRHAGSSVVVEVCDTGPGIAALPPSRVFEPMYSTRRERGGRGFGLTVSRSIATQHEGTIQVTSAPGAGATFTLTLPVMQRATSSFASFPAPLPAPLLPHRAVAATPVLPLVLSAPSVDAAAPTQVVPPSDRTLRPVSHLLLIEDEETLRAAISRFLRREGYEVDVASGGRDALAMLERRRYDVVLLDLRLQDLAGEEVYREIEARDPVQAQRVLFTTGDLHRLEAAEFVRSTGRAALAKPFLLSELQNRIAAVLAS